MKEKDPCPFFPPFSQFLSMLPIAGIPEEKKKGRENLEEESPGLQCSFKEVSTQPIRESSSKKLRGLLSKRIPIHTQKRGVPHITRIPCLVNGRLRESMILVQTHC